MLKVKLCVFIGCNLFLFFCGSKRPPPSSFPIHFFSFCFHNPFFSTLPKEMVLLSAISWRSIFQSLRMGVSAGPNSAKGALPTARYLHAMLYFVLNIHSVYASNPNRQDWTCEAGFQIYPLFPAILQYTIETLILDPNILRDSILVRLEMVTSQTLNLALSLAHTRNPSTRPYPPPPSPLHNVGTV